MLKGTELLDSFKEKLGHCLMPRHLLSENSLVIPRKGTTFIRDKAMYFFFNRDKAGKEEFFFLTESPHLPFNSLAILFVIRRQ